MFLYVNLGPLCRTLGVLVFPRGPGPLAREVRVAYPRVFMYLYDRR